jgi:hypothetical protein
MNRSSNKGGGASLWELLFGFRLRCMRHSIVLRPGGDVNTVKNFLIPASVVVAILAAVPSVQGHAPRVELQNINDYRSNTQNPDYYILIPAFYGISCDEARSILQKKGYRILKTIRCGGNYHKFKVQRRGFDYIVNVMTSRGKRMIDARSN